MEELTHFDKAGNAVMVDVSSKGITERTARARGVIRMQDSTLEIIKSGSAKKGDVLGVARLAGIMAAKSTSSLIPLCHPLSFDSCVIDFQMSENRGKGEGGGGGGGGEIEAVCSVKLSAKTGAEMEALTGVSVALLTIYDMCKAVDRAMVLSDIRLEEKSGGKSGHFLRTTTRRSVSSEKFRASPSASN